MSPDLTHPSFMKDHDPVGMLNGGKAVGNDQARPVVQDLFEGLLDEHLGSGVDRAGRLVQQQDAEHLVVDDALDHLRHTGQQLVELGEDFVIL